MEIFVVRVCHELPFDYKILKFASVSVRDMIKMSSSYKYFGTPPAPPTPPVFRVDLLHKMAIVQRILHPSVYNNVIFTARE